MVEKLHVLMNGREIGGLAGEGKNLRLLYNQQALDSPRTVPLSLSMPTTSARWKGNVISRWISALLPEREAVLARWRRDFRVTDMRAESLLPYVGEDVAGAAQFVSADRLETMREFKGGIVEVSASDIAQMLRAARADSSVVDISTGAGKFSLAGAQAKIALQKTASGWALPYGAEPTTHILKPAIPGLESQDLVEALTARTAANLGLPAAPTTLDEFDGERAVISERFDRVLTATGWRRVHQEDLCQALGANPQRKYEIEGGPSAAVCGELIRRYCPLQDVETFARTLITNHLLRGSDAHARNYSLLLTPGEVRLAPLYDLNSTLAYGANWAEHSSMSIGGEDRFSYVGRSNWENFALSLRLEPGWVLSELQGLAQRTPDALADAKKQSDLVQVSSAVGETMLRNVTNWCAETTKKVFGHS
ncbi:MAG: HipA domain-containing protein [Propionibacteriaceae bacterium]|nr:HipA domain-containing protein [Propionibacteriaceae bacterium]